MTEYRDTDFSGQEVLLNGNIFTGCTFRNCRVVYRVEAGPIAMGACRFKENIQWTFEGSAAITVEFLAMLYNQPNEVGRKLIDHILKKGGRGV